MQRHVCAANTLASQADPGKGACGGCHGPPDIQFNSFPGTPSTQACPSAAASLFLSILPVERGSGARHVTTPRRNWLTSSVYTGFLMASPGLCTRLPQRTAPWFAARFAIATTRLEPQRTPPTTQPQRRSLAVASSASQLPTVAMDAQAKTRARAAVLGAFVADAATTPLHWICEAGRA